MIFLFLFGGKVATANGVFDQFIDPDDGNLDASNWLSKKSGFLPLPIVITEPAVGNGAGAAFLFFHQTNKSSDSSQGSVTGQDEAYGLPPSVSGFAGAVTKNESWFGALFHSGSYRNDHIRYLAAYIHPSINLKFYGGNDSPTLNTGIEYNIKGDMLLQEVIFRLPDTDLFLGVRLSYFDSQSNFKLNTAIPGIEPWELDTNNFGAGLALKYDSRDNIFTPNRGWNVDAHAMWHDGSAIEDFYYRYYNLHLRYYWQINKRWILGLRAEGEFTSGEVPFYALPYISLRGIPAMRYQGTDVLTSEAELRWNLNPRWSFVGFAGGGTVAPNDGDLGDGPNHWSRGIGFRYNIAKKLGLYSGLDLARGPEDTVLYIQMGGAW